MKRLVFLLVLAGVAVTVHQLQRRGLIHLPFPTERQVDAARLSGTVEIRDARLEFLEREIVAEVLVDEGDLVTEGQVLARLRTDRIKAEIDEARARRDAQTELIRKLDRGSREQEIAQAEAQLAAARAQEARARRDHERFAGAAPSGASSRRDLDAAKATLEVAVEEVRVRELALDLIREGPREEDRAAAHADLAALEARIRLLEKRLADHELRSPCAGVLRSRNVEPGEMAAAGRTAFTIAVTARKWIRAYVEEPRLGRVHEGLEVSVRADAWPDRAFRGTVGFVSPVAEFTPRTIETEELRTRLVYEIRVWVDDPENGLRLGMPVSVLLD
ncbi:MAG: efflux RND transporter periplasmic adaptor subunit [Planctomycetes bacterium]|nr:efflux RND transporter periplasmic adaptor subunit [Planctomycetota bacterium]